MANDEHLLEEAYSQIYQEGILDRLKDQGAGLKAYAKQGLQNTGNAIARATGNKVEPTNRTATNAFADAQQKSLIKTFIKKAQKEVEDFKRDMEAMGGGDEAIKNDPSFTEAAQQIQQVDNLINYLNEFDAGNVGAAPTPATPSTPAGSTVWATGTDFMKAGLQPSGDLIQKQYKKGPDGKWMSASKQPLNPRKAEILDKLFSERGDKKRSEEELNQESKQYPTLLEHWYRMITDLN